MASAATQLAWGAITFRDGYEAAGQTEYIAKCLRWFTDYFVAAHTAEFEFYAQVVMLSGSGLLLSSLSHLE